MSNRNSMFIVLVSLLTVASCGKKSSSSDSGSTDSVFKGSLTSTSVSALTKSGLAVNKNITHVLAVSPKSSSPESFVAAIDESGTFNLSIRSGQPYIIVFVAQDGILTGSDMIAGIVKVAQHDLDALAVAKASEVELGDVTVDGNTDEATISTTVTQLRDSLGITSEQADYMGEVDDLALRLSNPDIDGNGVIDATENKRFVMDWHVRANNNLTFDQIENDFGNPALSWTLASGYAVYLTSFDNSDYVVNSGVSTALQNGGAFSSIGTSINPTSMSGMGFDQFKSWGPDYNLSAQEMGASDSAATFVYTLGSDSKKLTFTNVRTKTLAQLNANGVLLPLIKVNTDTDKVVTGISYKWVVRDNSNWVDADVEAVKMLAQENSAYLTFYTEKGAGVEKGISFNIPTDQASGTINIGASGFSSRGVEDVNSLDLDDFCSSALSYDDKIGLRLFAGAPNPNVGVTPCY